MNAATDNPLIFDGGREKSNSGGTVHASTDLRLRWTS